MDFLESLKNFIRPELMVLIPVLYFVGMGFKKSQYIADRHIPLLLGALGIFLSGVYVAATCAFGCTQEIFMAIFVALTQGILCAGASVYINQLIKQSRKGDDND